MFHFPEGLPVFPLSFIFFRHSRSDLTIRRQASVLVFFITAIALLLSFSANAAAPDAGGNILVTAPGGGATTINGNDSAPAAANIRITPTTLNDADASTPNSIRLISIDGGTITKGDGSAITLGASPLGTTLLLTAGHYDARFTPATNRNTPATIQYVVVDPDSITDSNQSTISVNITALPSPTITVTAQTSGDTTPALSGTVSRTAATISITVNSQTYPATNNSNGTWTLADNTITPALGNGTYDVQASATDAFGTGIDATSNELTIDTSAPLITINTLNTSDNRPALSGTVSDNGATISIQVDGQTHAATNNGDGTWALPDDTINPALGDGIYHVVASATSGGIGSDATSNELTIDSTAPTVTVNTLTTNDQRPAITGTVNEPSATITVDVDAQIGLVATNNGDGSWTLADDTINPALSANSYNVTVTATDPAGNIANPTTPNALVIDLTSPTITINTLSTADTSPSLTGTINDNTANIRVLINGQTLSATNNGDSTWTLANNLISALTSGTYTVTAQATDVAGNIGNDATSNELYVDATPPGLSIALVGTSPNSDASLQFDLTFTEAVSNVSAADFSVNSTSTATITNVATTDSSHYRLTVSGGDLSSFDGTVGIDVAPGRDIADALGNLLPASEPVSDPVFTHIPFNPSPVLSGIDGASLTWLSNATIPVILDSDSNATVTDQNSANFNGGSLNVSITAGLAALEDVLGLNTAGTVDLSALTNGSNVSVASTVIGTLGADISAGNNLLINLNVSATPANVSQLLRAINYDNVSAAPTLGQRTILITMSDSVFSGTATVSVNVNSPPPTPPETSSSDPTPLPGTTISGALSNNGTLSNVTISSGSSLSGGYLSGAITNHGTISNVSLLTGSSINGGIVSGTIEGVPGQFNLVNATLAPGTTVNNVTLGPDAIIPPDIILGPNVRFSEDTVIPPGLNLTPVFSLFNTGENSSVSVINLATIFFADGPDIIELIGSVEGLASIISDLVQDQNTGELQLVLNQNNVLMFPVHISQAEPGTTPGISLNSDGNIVLVTENGLSIIAFPTLENFPAFENESFSFGLDIEMDERANLRLVRNGTSGIFIVRPDILSAPATFNQKPGLHFYLLDQSSNLNGIVLVFENSDGILMQQELFPVPVNWPAMKSSLSSVAGVSDVSINRKGIVRFTVNGFTMYARADIRVVQGDATQTGSVKFNTAGDLNGDGLNDYFITYPDGSQQALYVF